MESKTEFFTLIMNDSGKLMRHGKVLGKNVMDEKEKLYRE